MSNPSARPASTLERARRLGQRGLLLLASLALLFGAFAAGAGPPRPLNVGADNYPTVITITGQTAVVIEPYGYTVGLINLKTGGGPGDPRPR